MKFLHISDIHLGKRLHGRSLHDDQEHILSQYLALAAREDCQAILIAGDVYNRSQPQPEAIDQFSRFLTGLAELNKPVFIVRGNHDGEAQLAYAAPLLAQNNIHISPAYDGNMPKITLTDEHGEIDVYLLPYIKPIQARRAFPDAGVETYADAIEVTLKNNPTNPANRSVLITHQYVMGAETSDSEERSLGGLDQIPPAMFKDYDYVALGHLHKSQTFNKGRIRYCGAPLVYSFDECSQTKTATMVTLGPKGTENELEFIPLEPLRPCRRLEGEMADLIAQPRTEDYVQIILTDKIRPLDPVGTLRVTYPNLLNLMFLNRMGELAPQELPRMESLTNPLDHFVEFFTYQNETPPTDEQLEIIRKIIAEGGEDA